jgi:hypothetical protein
VGSAATADKPTGIINYALKVPVNKEFIFDDAKAEFGKYAFRFANGSFTESTAKQA